MTQAHRYHVVPHTHWDREWYRPFEYFQLRLGFVVDGVLDVLERNEAFTTFTLDGQAIVLEDYVEARPANEERLRRLVGDGRIEIGPSYVLPDEFLVGSESLVRNLLIGRTVCRRFGGEPSPVGYLPDSFGHPAQLPQILAGFGIETFVFSRGMGDELDEVGAIFAWRAPDGSEVRAFQLMDHYGNFAFLAGVEDAASRVRGIQERFGDLLERMGVNDVLLCNGTDHVPAMPELPSLCGELEQRLPGTRFMIARYEDYIRAVGDVPVPVWSGELLGSRIQNVLRGVNSARLYVKQANEEAERRISEVETLAALRGLADGWPFPGSDFELVWRQLLRCHPHDTICGCSCDEVHRDAMARYESVHRSLDVLEGRALDGLAVREAAPETVGVVNVLPFARRGLVEWPGAEPRLVELDGFSARTLDLEPRSRASLPPPARDGMIESDRFRVEVAQDGTLTVLDKEEGDELAGLHRLEDEADMGDLYNFCPTSDGTVWRSEGASARVLRDGPLVHELELEVRASRPAGLDDEFQPVAEQRELLVRTVVRLVQGLDRVEFQTTIENRLQDHRLRVIFPIGRGDGPVRAESAFAVVRRQAEPPTPTVEWVEPPDATQHTLGAVAAGPVALVSKGLPEYEVRQGPGGSELCLTLLRCVGLISRGEGALRTRPRSAGPQVQTPEGQCLGEQRSQYALFPAGGELEDVELSRAAQDYRYGFLTTSTPVALEAPLSLEGDVAFSCLKGAEDRDGLILRFFNPGAEPVAARVRGQRNVVRTRLDETGEQALPDGALELGPGEVATLRLRA